MKYSLKTLSEKNGFAAFILFIIFIVAFYLRVMYLPQNSLSFAYDQARDAFVVREILNGDLKILGPSVSGVPGLYHGVLYYYVIAPAYLIGEGNPIFVAYYMSFISSLGVFVVYFLTKLLTKMNAAGIIAALIFAFSFEATQYANLLTNASMGVWFVPVIYIGLYLWVKKRSKLASVLTGFGFGLAVQSEVALAYHLAPIIIWLYLSRKTIERKEIIYSLLCFVLAVSPMLLSEVKFGFKGISGIMYLFLSKDGIVRTKELSDFVVTFLNQSGKTFAYSLFPINVVFGGLLGFIITIWSLVKGKVWAKYLALYIFAYLVALPFGGWNMKHILVGTAPAVCVLVAIFLWENFRSKIILLGLLIVIILFSNLYKVTTENKNGQTLFPLQSDLVLRNEIMVIDYTYKQHKGDDFSISTLTSPLNVNTLWSYLYNWYGNEKYGYLPYWIGQNQIGQLGNNLKNAPTNVGTHYFIIEPAYGIPDTWINYAKGDQDAMSTLEKEQTFGQIIVQSRTKTGVN